MKKILIVDDEESILEVLKGFALAIGLKPEVAKNGREAMALLEEEKFDIVITDMLMPIMTGRELVKFIRGDNRFKEIPIILFSGYLDIYSVKDLLEEGVTYFLQKPVSLSELKEYISKCFQGN